MWVNFRFSIRRWTPGFVETTAAFAGEWMRKSPQASAVLGGRQWLDDVFLAVAANVQIMNLHRQKGKTLVAELLQGI